LNVKKGTRFRATTDFPAICLTHWMAPFTGGYSVVVPAGEILVVPEDPPSFATGVALVPERYDHFLQVFVPPEDRNAEKFGGYSLAVPFDDLQKSCARIE
jgi:hypothetical protein